MKLYLNKDVDISKLTVDDINDMLIAKIKDYIDSINNTELERKPDEFQYNLNTIKHASNIDDELEQVNLTNQTKIDRQLYTIAENIVLEYFSLDNEKFKAVLERITFWGMQLTMQQFIMSYYLFYKTNNYLRQFILIHLDKLLKIVCKMIEKQLVTKLNLYNFDSNLNSTLKTLKQSLVQKQRELQKVQPENLVVTRDANIDDINDVAQMKLDILENLRKEHPELQD